MAELVENRSLVLSPYLGNDTVCDDDLHLRCK